MIRLTLLGILCLLSLLTIFKAPTYHLWLVAILVSEYCLIFVAITCALLVWSLLVPEYRMLATMLSAVAMLLFCSPIIRAEIISKNLPDGLSRALCSEQRAENPFSLWRMASGVQQQTVVPKTFTYASHADVSLTLDFYPSSKKTNRPCILVVHGGSWKSGDNKQLTELNSHLAAVGYNVAAINYRLAPRFRSPLQIQDVKAALDFLKGHSRELRIDTNQIVLLGRSAGAQIALLAAYTLNEPEIKGVINFYGPADMIWGYSIPASPLVMDSRKVMEDYLGGTYQNIPEKYQQSSPIHFVNKGSVPTLIIHGKNDVLVAYEHSRRLQGKLNRNGVPNYFLSLPWATHGFDFNINGPGGQLSTFAVKYFIRSITDEEALPD